MEETLTPSLALQDRPPWALLQRGEGVGKSPWPTLLGPGHVAATSVIPLVTMLPPGCT